MTQNPLSPNENRHAKLTAEREVLEDLSDLFELYSAAARVAGDTSNADAFETVRLYLSGLNSALTVTSRILAETGRITWDRNHAALQQAVTDGTLSAARFERIRLHWGPPAPAHTQDAAVPPTGYHAAMHSLIRETLASGGAAVSMSPDPYAPPFRIEPIKSDTPDGFPLKGFTLYARENFHGQQIVSWRTVVQPWPPREDLCGAVTTALEGTSWCTRRKHTGGKHRVISDTGEILREWENLDDTLARHALERAHGAHECYDRTRLCPAAGLPAALQPAPAAVMENYPVPERLAQPGLCDECATADSVGPCCADTPDNDE